MTPSLKLIHNLNHSKSLPNMTIVRQERGYAEANTILSKLSDDLALFYVYIRYLSNIQRKAEVVKEHYFLYNSQEENMWEDIGIDRRYFVDKLAKLEKNNHIIKQDGGKRLLLYYIPPMEFEEEVIIPMLFLTSKELAWLTKIRFFKLLLHLQKNKIDTVPYRPSSDKSVSKVHGLSPLVLTQLFKDLAVAGFVDAQANIIDTTQILTNISMQVAEQNIVTATNERMKRRKAEATIKKQSKTLSLIKGDVEEKDRLIAELRDENTYLKKLLPPTKETNTYWQNKQRDKY
jgi:hypothetical protein